MRKYEIPEFISAFEINQKDYTRWLENKARTHYNRDKKYFGEKFNSKIKPKEYKLAIHNAVIKSDGKCFYTDEKLAWNKINKFGSLIENNKRDYDKRKYELLPTLEHIDRSVHSLNFAIVSWKVNDAKNNLNIEEFLELCKLVISKENNIITKLMPYKKQNKYTLFGMGWVEL